MRKILLCLSLFAVCALSGCTKETTYTFQNVRNWPEESSDLLSNVTFFIEEYDNSGDIVANHGVSFSESKSKQEFTASSYAEKIRVRMQFNYNGYSSSLGDSQLYYVEEGKNIDIVIDDGTTFVENRP